MWPSDAAAPSGQGLVRMRYFMYHRPRPQSAQEVSAMAGNGVLPAEDEIPDLIPGPGSVAWRLSSDARIMSTAGYALLLQVAHPTVGAGVHEPSNLQANPWGSLLR